MTKKKICKFCKKETKGKLTNNLCKDCFKKLENWDIVEINKKLKEFEKLKSKEALKFLKDEVLNLFVKMQQLKDYLVEDDIILEDDFKSFCLDRESYEKEKEFEAEEIEENNAWLCIVSLQKNEQLKDLYMTNKKKGSHFVEIKKKSDFKKLSECGMIYFLSSEDITKEYKEEISKLGSDLIFKLAVSGKKFKNLNDSCPTHIKASRDYRKTHTFLKRLIECVALPSLVGLDYATIGRFLIMSSKIDLRKYTFKLNEKDKIIKKIKKEFKKIDNSFFVITGGTDMILEDIIDIAERIKKISRLFSAFGSIIDEGMKDKIEVNLFAGWRK